MTIIENLPNFCSLDEYKKYFHIVFTEDTKFSQKFKRQIDKIILQNIAEIHDHETEPTEQDRITDINGIDRTVKVPLITFGRRIRRNKYLDFGEFTIDTKEWRNSNKPKYYIFGYANLAENELVFYMLWDHKGFTNLAQTGEITHGCEKNNGHSTVPFYTFSLKDIFDKCDILEVGGYPEDIRRVLGNVPKNNSKLGEFA